MSQHIRKRLFILGCAVAAFFLILGFITDYALLLGIGLLFLFISLESNVAIHTCKCGRKLLVRKSASGFCRCCGEKIVH